MYNTTIDYHAGIISIFSRTSCTQSWRPVTMASFLMKLNHAMKSVYMICCYILSGTAFIFRTLCNHRGRDWKPDQLTPINKYSPGSSSPQAFTDKMAGTVTAQNVLPENCPADRLWQPNLVRDQIWLPYLVLLDRMWLPYSVPPCHIMSARGPNVASIFCPVGPYMAAIFGPGPNVAATFGPGPNVSN